jgi:hypothetical protein
MFKVGDTVCYFRSKEENLEPSHFLPTTLSFSSLSTLFFALTAPFFSPYTLSMTKELLTKRLRTCKDKTESLSINEVIKEINEKSDRT